MNASPRVKVQKEVLTYSAMVYQSIEWATAGQFIPVHILKFLTVHTAEFFRQEAQKFL